MSGWKKLKNGYFYTLTQTISIGIDDSSIQLEEVDLENSLFRLYQMNIGEGGVTVGYQLHTTHNTRNFGNHLVVYHKQTDKDLSNARPVTELGGGLCIFSLGGDIALLTSQDGL